MIRTSLCILDVADDNSIKIVAVCVFADTGEDVSEVIVNGMYGDLKKGGGSFSWMGESRLTRGLY